MLEAYRAWLEQVAKGDDPLFHTIVDLKTGKAVGVATFMRIDRANGVIEVGNINYSPLLQRTPAATEAMFLMMARVFDELGYRRYEWKCDALNAPSRAAALRLGFQYEGLFRQAVIYKGRNRDTDLVLHHRQRVAGAEAGLRAVAGAGEFRWRGEAAARPGRSHQGGPIGRRRLTAARPRLHLRWRRAACAAAPAARRAPSPAASIAGRGRRRRWACRRRRSCRRGGRLAGS